VPAEVARRAQVDLLPAEHGRELDLHRGEPEQARLAAGLELDEQVDVAVRPRGAA
jgi:hypothetical protein